jgi:hypothetical protein
MSMTVVGQDTEAFREGGHDLVVLEVVAPGPVHQKEQVAGADEFVVQVDTVDDGHDDQNDRRFDRAPR